MKEADEATTWHNIAEDLQSTDISANIEDKSASPSLTQLRPFFRGIQSLFLIPSTILRKLGFTAVKNLIESIASSILAVPIIRKLLLVDSKSAARASTRKDTNSKQILARWQQRSQTIASVPRVSSITPEELHNEYILKNLPVIISHHPLSEQAAPYEGNRFSRDFFSTIFGEHIVRVSVSETGRFDGPEDGSLWGLSSSTDVLVRPPSTSMTMSDFLMLSKQPSMKEVFYLEYSALHQYLESFQHYMPTPEIIQDVNLTSLVSNIWIGTKPTSSPLHYDDYENFLCQLKGQKELILFPPQDLPNLYYIGRPKGVLEYSYPGNFTRNPKNVDKRGFVFGSSVLIDEPDLKKYPKYAKAKPIRALLSPGDILYLPVFWHHEVQSIPDEQDGINVAVNYWFKNASYPINDAELLKAV
jgi:hypothetical protein